MDEQQTTGLRLTERESNCSLLTAGEDLSILFSFGTPVAAQVKGTYFRTEKKWSRSTSTHTSRWLREHDALDNAETAPQEWFDNLLTVSEEDEELTDALAETEHGATAECYVRSEVRNKTLVYFAETQDGRLVCDVDGGIITETARRDDEAGCRAARTLVADAVQAQGWIVLKEDPDEVTGGWQP